MINIVTFVKICHWKIIGVPAILAVLKTAWFLHVIVQGKIDTCFKEKQYFRYQYLHIQYFVSIVNENSSDYPI